MTVFFQSRNQKQPLNTFIPPQKKQQTSRLLLGMRQYLAMASKLGEMQKVFAGREDDDMMADEPPTPRGFFVSNFIGNSE